MAGDRIGPTVRVAAIGERRQALRDRYATWHSYTLDGWLDRCAEQYAERPLVLTNALTLTYGDVADQSRCLADGLAALGVRPGDRVGMLMANYPEFVPVKFAIARVGAIAVPFNFLYRRDELRYVLAQSGCAVLVTMTGFAGLDYQSMLDEIAPGWDVPDFAERERASDDAVPALRHVVLFDTGVEVDEGPQSTRPLRPEREPGRNGMTLAGLAGLGRENAGASPGLTAQPTDPADMLYTSGTTGSPKGVITSHDAVLRTAYASALTRGYEDGRRILFSLPCYHMFGYIEGLLSVMFAGGAIIPLTSFSAEAYFAGIQLHRATDILCVPTMAVAMVESDQRTEYDLSSLTAILCGSAPAPIWLWTTVTKEFGVEEIVTGYGMTECGGAMTLTRPEDALELTSETVGRPKIAGAAGVPGTDEIVVYRTADPETGELLADGCEGELVSAGPTAMLEYWDKPEATAATLRDGWVYSGDLGVVRGDGYLTVTGRSKELYKSGGELVMPKEIEDLLAAHDGISQVFAIGITDDRWGEIGCAVIVPAPGAAITEDEVIAICRARLARFKVPKRVVFCRPDELPKTPTGKVQKFKLAQRFG